MSGVYLNPRRVRVVNEAGVARQVQVVGIRARFDSFDVVPLALNPPPPFTNFAGNMGITGQNVSTARRNNAKLYGSNGTFFYNRADHAEAVGYRIFDVYRIQMSANSPVPTREVRNVGNVNLSHAEVTSRNPCGTFVVFNQSIGGVVAVEQQLRNIGELRVNGNTVPLSNIRYAMGGTSLAFADRTLTRDRFNNMMSREGGSGIRDNRPRTAIVYMGTGVQDTLLLNVYADNLRTIGSVTETTNTNTGVTLWELRQLIIDHFLDPAGRIGLGVNLDGGGSTQLHIRHAGTDHSFRGSPGSFTSVPTMITVPM